MARPVSAGLDYFNMDVDFFNDDKLELISSEFGCRGESITIRLLCLIYRNGYYYQWGKDECLLFAKRVGNGVTGALVEEVINGLIKRSFFDKGVFDRFTILTSRGIQKRYVEAKARAKDVVFLHEILLIDDIDALKHNNVTFKSINVNINAQSKVKEKKVKESKDGVDLIFPFNSENFKQKWDAWKSYKKDEHRFNYKSLESEQASLNELVTLSQGIEENAIAIILQSMAKGWKGFFSLKNIVDGTTKKGQQSGNKISGTKLHEEFNKFHSTG